MQVPALVGIFTGVLGDFNSGHFTEVFGNLPAVFRIQVLADFADNKNITCAPIKCIWPDNSPGRSVC